VPSEIEKFKQFAKEVYKVVKGEPCPTSADPENFGPGVPLAFIDSAISYWVEEGVMERTGLGTRAVCLTHYGVAEIESWTTEDSENG
jgi:hypothetical protein